MKGRPFCLKLEGALFYAVRSDHRTHFSILNKEYIERDEHAEVEDVDVVLYSHLR